LISIKSEIWMRQTSSLRSTGVSPQRRGRGRRPRDGWCRTGRKARGPIHPASCFYQATARSVDARRRWGA
jgi:hypothetical protein